MTETAIEMFSTVGVAVLCISLGIMAIAIFFTLLDYVQHRIATFKLKYSKATNSKYYANTCPNCHVISGDFYLHSEPGSPFFPTEDHEAESLQIEVIPLYGLASMHASCGFGVGELILEKAKVRSTEAGR